MTGPRLFFVRLPQASTPEEALDVCPPGSIPRLHRCEDGIVGSVEIQPPRDQGRDHE